MLLQAQAVLKEQLSRCLEEGLALEASLNSRKAALEKTKRETEETAAEKEAVKRETKRSGSTVKSVEGLGFSVLRV